MPEFFQNLNLDLIHIDDTDKLLNKVKETKSIYKLISLIKKIEEATQKVEQNESLVVKLEN
jgi:reverse gyrase